jgi:hypothetical protein
MINDYVKGKKKIWSIRLGYTKAEMVFGGAIWMSLQISTLQDR